MSQLGGGTWGHNGYGEHAGLGEVSLAGISLLALLIVDAPLITQNQEECAGADGHGKDMMAMKDREDAMSEVVGREPWCSS